MRFSARRKEQPTTCYHTEIGRSVGQMVRAYVRRTAGKIRPLSSRLLRANKFDIHKQCVWEKVMCVRVYGDDDSEAWVGTRWEASVVWNDVVNRTDEQRAAVETGRNSTQRTSSRSVYVIFLRASLLRAEKQQQRRIQTNSNKLSLINESMYTKIYDRATLHDSDFLERFIGYFTTDLALLTM